MSTYPPDLESYVQQKIASGEFQSVEEFAVVAANFYRRLEERKAELKASIDAAIAEIEAGECGPIDFDELTAEVMANLDKKGLP